MSAELMSILGAVMLAVALGALWVGKLKSHAVSAVDNHSEAPDPESVSLRPSKGGRIIMQAAPTSRALDETGGSSDMLEAENTQVQEVETQDPKLPAEVDCPDAENNLTVAKTLANMGDYEGASELAQLVVDSISASQTQKVRAKGLVTRSNSR